MNLDDDLVAQAKAYAASKHRTFTSVMEEGLRRVLIETQTPAPRERIELPVSSAGDPAFPFDPEILNSAKLWDEYDAWYLAKMRAQELNDGEANAPA